MIDRRAWMGSALAGGLAFATGGLPAQEPTSRRVARRPALNPSRTAMRPALEPWEASLASDPNVEAALAPIAQARGVPGMVGAIIQGAAIVAAGAVGVRKVGSNQPIRVTDLLHLGSCGKAMTATMIGALFEDRLLAPSTTIASLFPDDARWFHAGFRGLTLWDLMTQRSGLPHDAPWWRLPGRTTTEQRQSAMRRLLADAPRARPGTTYEYSNASYVLAGLMAEQATGQSWEDLMRDRVFGPLNMFSAGFGPPGAGGSSVDQPFGHRLNRGRLEPIWNDNAPCMGPAGTIHCTIADWAKFAIAHNRGERADGRLLHASTFAQLHTPPKGSEYAGGWYAVNRSWAGGRALMHSGSNTYWYCTAWLAPARDLAFLIVVNRGDGQVERACDEAVAAMLAMT